LVCTALAGRAGELAHTMQLFAGRHSLQRHTPMNTSIPIKRKNPLPPVQHEEIVIRAREFWSKAGSPEGRDLEFWLAAEHELHLERQNVAETVAGIVPPEGGERLLLLAPAEPARGRGVSVRAPVSHRENMPRKPRR
jgi:hypothetical protein